MFNDIVAGNAFNIFPSVFILYSVQGTMTRKNEVFGMLAAGTLNL